MSNLKPAFQSIGLYVRQVLIWRVVGFFYERYTLTKLTINCTSIHACMPTCCWYKCIFVIALVEDLNN